MITFHRWEGKSCPGARNEKGGRTYRKSIKQMKNLKAVATHLKIDGLRTEQMMLACKRGCYLVFLCIRYNYMDHDGSHKKWRDSGCTGRGEPTGFEEINIDGNIRAKARFSI